MPLKVAIPVVHMISAHHIPGGVDISMPTVIPWRFNIPEAPESEDNLAKISKQLRETHRVQLMDPDENDNGMIPYAEVRTSDKDPYIYLSIPDGVTRRIGYAEQTVDERGHVLSPNVERSLLVVRAANIANEIERAGRVYGIITIAGEEPTAKELALVFNLARAWEVGFVNDTTQKAAQLGRQEVTQNSIFMANRLFRKGLITALPPWAVVQAVEDLTTSKLVCANCGKVNRPELARCECGAVLNWKLAVERGIIRPADVPVSKLKEAGLTPLPHATKAQAEAQV